MTEVKLEDIVSLAKRRGFIFQGSEIYGGLAGTWDYGPLGTRLRHNLQNLWWQRMVDDHENIFSLDSAILMNPKVWEASGHTAGFKDPMVVCDSCHAQYRADHLIEEMIDKNKNSSNPVAHEIHTGHIDNMDKNLDIFRPDIQCPSCGKKGTFGKVRMFNMMLRTHIGVLEDESIVTYLRPETAQGIFTNYKNILDSFSPKLPFGIAQIGKAFRNEISPRDFIFRDRELEQMEMQYFINPAEHEKQYEYWRKFAWDFLTKDLMIDEKALQWHEHGPDERAHYAKAAHDIEFNFPFGFKELWGTHYRTDYDLSNHAKVSGKDLSYFDQSSGEKFIPHVVESSVGLDRMMLAVLTNVYSEDEQGGEKRIFLKMPSHLAPFKAAVFPLLKNKPELVKKAREVYKSLKKETANVMWDDNGNIGKRYRRQDEIGTPYCITVDFDTLKDDTVTVRDRDTTDQKRIKVNLLIESIG